MATVTFRPEAAKELDRLPKAIPGERLYAVAQRLQHWPDVSGGGENP